MPMRMQKRLTAEAWHAQARGNVAMNADAKVREVDRALMHIYEVEHGYEHRR